MARVEIRGCVKIQKKYERCDATLGRVLIPASSQIIKSTLRLALLWNIRWRPAYSSQPWLRLLMTDVTLQLLNLDSCCILPLAHVDNLPRWLHSILLVLHNDSTYYMAFSRLLAYSKFNHSQSAGCSIALCVDEGRLSSLTHTLTRACVWEDHFLHLNHSW